jgi:hypothetical protein
MATLFPQAEGFCPRCGRTDGWYLMACDHGDINFFCERCLSPNERASLDEALGERRPPTRRRILR